MVRVQSLKPIEDYNVELVFSNNETRMIDLESYLRGPIFDPIRNDHEKFIKVKVDKVAGTIHWPNGADIDPDVLFGSQVPHWAENKVSG